MFTVENFIELVKEDMCYTTCETNNREDGLISIIVEDFTNANSNRKPPKSMILVTPNVPDTITPPVMEKALKR